MPVILLVVVAVVWIAILGRGMVRRRTSGVDGITSISDFHQQLRVLEHSSPPPIVAPAYRLHSIGGRRVSPEEAEGPDHESRPILTVVGAKDLPRPALAFLGEGADDQPGPAESSAAVERTDARVSRSRPSGPPPSADQLSYPPSGRIDTPPSRHPTRSPASSPFAGAATPSACSPSSSS